MINSLNPNQIFVFGSNLSGLHLGGAAKQAHADFGAEMGASEGLTGQCYAFPTLDTNLYRLGQGELVRSRDNLYHCATLNPDKEFLLTKVGCGIAGYEEEYIKSLFTNIPSNVTLPNDWL